MALTFSTPNGNLIIPGAPASWITAPSNSGLSTTGVVILVGEADVGPDFTSEPDVTLNFFGPRQYAAVQRKYSSGHIVDAFRALTAPSNDAGVRGSPSAVYVLKTNKGTKASGSLGTYGVLQALSEGSFGDLLSYSVSQAAPQVLPSYSAAYVLDSTAETIKIASNGDAPWALAATPGYTTPALAAVGLMDYAPAGTDQSFDKDIMVNGGQAFQPCAGPLAGNISLSASSYVVTITLDTATWATQPVIGQTLIIPSGSSIQGGSNQNRGFYIVTSVTLNRVVAKKVKEANGAAPSVPPVAVSTVAVTGTDFQTYNPLTFTAVRGVKRTDQSGITSWSGAISGSNFVLTLTTGGEQWAVTPKVGDLCKFFRTNHYWLQVVSATANSVTLAQLAPTPAIVALPAFVSEAVGASTVEFINPLVPGVSQSLLFWRDQTSGGTQFYGADATPSVISSTGGLFTGSDQEISVNVSRVSDNVSETWTAGGDVVLTLGKDATAHTVVSITGTLLSLGTDAVVDVSKYRTLGDLVAYINTVPSWHAAVTAAFKQLAPATVLDRIAAGSGAEDEAGASNQNLFGAMPCRIKKDAYDVTTQVGFSSVLQFVPTLPTKGLPPVQAVAFLANGAKGGTADSDVQAALNAAGLIKGNFVVTLFSQSAASDFAAGETESSSSYDIASVNAALNDHISRFSVFKSNKPRQGFPSFRGTYAAAKVQAQTIANFRCAGVNFLDVTTLGANGIQQFQPWMGAAIEAGFQAAAFYKPIFNKQANVSGVIQAAGDFNPSDDDAVEDALLNGLTVIRGLDGGGFGFVKDNTTYGFDNNFAYNSVQAVYVADVVSQTASIRMNRAFVGQSFADVSTTVVLSFFKNVMESVKALKLITGSSDAPSGYRNVVIDIQAPAIQVSAEIKLATGVYWIPLQFLVTEVQGSATF